MCHERSLKSPKQGLRARFIRRPDPSHKDKLKRKQSEMENDGRPPDSNDTLGTTAKVTATARRPKSKAENTKHKEDEKTAIAKKEAKKKAGAPLLYMQKSLHYDALRLYRDDHINPIPGMAAHHVGLILLWKLYSFVTFIAPLCLQKHWQKKYHQI